MKIVLQGEQVELSDKAEDLLIDFMKELSRLMPDRGEAAWGRAYIFDMLEDHSILEIELEFGSNTFPPNDDLGKFAVFTGL